MAPRGPHKARDFDYTKLGTHGRRTGITLKEGKRDEHGMEEIDGIFSSPEKSPAKANGYSNGNESMTGSDGMSMDEGNAPEVSDFLGSPNAHKPAPVPSMRRSPMKPGLSSSSRRAPMLQSIEPVQNAYASSSESEGDDLGARAVQSHFDASPLNARAPKTQRAAQSDNLRNGTKTTGWEREIEDPGDFSDEDSNSLLDGDQTGDFDDQSRDNLAESLNSVGRQSENGPSNLNHEESGDDGANAQSPDAAAPSSRRTEHSSATKRTKGTGTRRNQKTTPQRSNGATAAAPKRKRQGRVAQRDDDDDAADQRPPKKVRSTGQGGSNANGPLDPELGKVVENYAHRTGPLKGRSLYILKRELPSESGATQTRSGRVSVRPLAYWRNERCVYGDGDAEVGQRFPLSTIKEIIRTEELEPDRPSKARKRSSQKKRGSKRNRDADSGDESDARDVWEKDRPGVLSGYIPKWDSEAQASSTEEVLLDIAFSPVGIDTKEVKDSTFRFAKLLSLPFLGSGVVDVPPGGVKRPKNSKKMHMVFYVCHGRVQVDVSGNQFSAGKGCVFQVPRGNYYSFANTHETDARLFFTQGCISVESESSLPGSAAKPMVAQREVRPEAVPTGASTAKGRGKGKQKGSKA